MESNNNFCIYITKYKRKKCTCNTIVNKKFCYKHAKYKKQEFFELLQTIYDNNYNLENINIKIINDCFNYLYNIDTNIEGKNMFSGLFTFYEKEGAWSYSKSKRFVIFNQFCASI
mgnify:CR=1 FL=1